jgi:hypothetical protein
VSVTRSCTNLRDPTVGRYVRKAPPKTAANSRQASRHSTRSFLGKFPRRCNRLNRSRAAYSSIFLNCSALTVTNFLDRLSLRYLLSVALSNASICSRAAAYSRWDPVGRPGRTLSRIWLFFLGFEIDSDQWITALLTVNKHWALFVFHGHDLGVSCRLSGDRGSGFPASIHFFEIINPTFSACSGVL